MPRYRQRGQSPVGTRVSPLVLASADQTARLRRLGDVLAPASETMPSFSEADKSGRFLLRAFEALPHLAPLAIAAADALGDSEPREYSERLSVERPEMFSALHSTVVGAYLINRRVWKRLRYPGASRRPCSTTRRTSISKAACSTR